MKSIVYLGLGLLLVPGGVAFSQAPDSTLVRKRARIYAPTVQPEPLIGRVLARDSVTLVLRPDFTTNDVPVAFSAIRKMELSRGHQRGWWALAGFGVGLVGGVAVGSVIADNDHGTSGGANLAPVGAALVGMIAGPIIGAVAAPERWRPVAVPPPFG
jgi:hypothetical protein